MKSKNFTMFLMVLLIVGSFTSLTLIEKCKAPSVLPKFYVDDNYNSSTPGWHEDHFDTIQDAIDSPNCTNGDRIIVYEGTYCENLIVNKSVDIFAEGKDDTIIDGKNNGSVITISAGNVDISTFTIKSSNISGNTSIVEINSDNCKIVDNIITGGIHGIFINNCHGCTIAYNTLTYNGNGTFLYSSDNNTIYHNYICNNYNIGILLNETCGNNNISSNDIYENTGNGIYLNDHCDQNNITNNNIYSNGNAGIRTENSSSNIYVNNNIIKNTQYGIMVVGSGNEINENTISDNGKYGVLLLADDNSVISGDVIRNNTLDGIRLQNSTNGKILGNRITGNSRYGIFLNFYAVDNEIFNNYFEDNGNNSKDISSALNIWNTTKANGSNIINGPCLGGNYWDDYNGVDSDGDGIGDTSYSIPWGNSWDRYPLVRRPPSSIAGGPYHGSTSEKIKFDGSGSSSPDGEIISYTWDFGDGTVEDGKDLMHNYSSAGNYSVTLTVVNNLGGTDIDTTYAVITRDMEPPSIDVDQHSSSGDIAEIYTFGAYVTDNVGISDVTIEYWYDNSSDRITADMNYKGDNYYEKVIIPEGKPERVYCIIYAKDLAGNENNTMSPTAYINVKNHVNISELVVFNASKSFDLDGKIIEYSWDFGDGIKRNESETTHTYAADGKYTVTLTVTDNDGKTDIAYSTVEVAPKLPKEASNATLNTINNNKEYNVNLTKPFLCYDLDNNGKYDTFFDPNKILTAINAPVNISGNISFLISVNDSAIPAFFWTPKIDKITSINYVIGSFDDKSIRIDEEKEQATIDITVDKKNWIYLGIDDTRYPNSSLTIKTGDRMISSDMIWRKNNKIYVLDDPGTTYQLIFENIFPPVESPMFSPVDGGIINENSTTITISYNVPVKITYASFADIHIESDLKTDDNKVFTYTPPGYWANGTYTFEIKAQAVQGSSHDLSNVVYFYFKYAKRPEKSFLEANWIWISLAGIIIAGIAIYNIGRYKQIAFEGFIYIKNKKILPFFKTVIFGPVSVNIDNNEINKAEFYVDDRLKETLTGAPYLWEWNEKAFLKHTLETKIYDKKGTATSSGKMTFYIFNPPRFNLPKFR